MTLDPPRLIGLTDGAQAKGLAYLQRVNEVGESHAAHE